MIKKVIGTVFLLAVGAVLMYYALSHHVVRAQSGTVTVPKDGLALKDTYADIREWSANDFDDHPELARALIENGHADLVPSTVGGKIKEWLKGQASDLLD